ncbi:MAG TPA: TadE/TadG family type IV pilus assembly protein [Acidimicrobiales bacterium]|nr:TadE/TadG family type IV pilus assembly protein [Acidimicrobiales bacterium]
MTRERSGGQASVELALALPLVAMLLLLVAQAGLVVRDQVLVVHAAREAARRAAVDPAEASWRQAATRAAPLDPERLAVAVARGAGRGDEVTVRLSYRSPTIAPIIGPLLPDILLRGKASMRREYE